MRIVIVVASKLFATDSMHADPALRSIVTKNRSAPCLLGWHTLSIVGRGVYSHKFFFSCNVEVMAGRRLSTIDILSSAAIEISWNFEDARALPT